MLIFEKIILRELSPTERICTFVLMKLSKSFSLKLKQYREMNNYLKQLFLCSTAEKEMNQNADKFSDLDISDLVYGEKDADLRKFISYCG